MTKLLTPFEKVVRLVGLWQKALRSKLSEARTNPLFRWDNQRLAASLKSMHAESKAMDVEIDWIRPMLSANRDQAIATIYLRSEISLMLTRHGNHVDVWAKSQGREGVQV